MPTDKDGQWMGPIAFNIADTTIDDGQGHTMTDKRGLFVLHAVLMHTGKVLVFSGHVETAMYASFSYVFDPQNPTAQLSPSAFPPGADLFCCHYVQIPDGRILALGGSQSDSHHPTTGAVVYRGSTASKTIGVFDPSSERWAVSRDGANTNELQQGRWYPTPVLLPDGRVAVFSGRRELDDEGHQPSGTGPANIATMVEILTPDSTKSSTDNWHSVELQNATKALPIYPGLHLAPNGVWCTRYLRLRRALPTDRCELRKFRSTSVRKRIRVQSPILSARSSCSDNQ